MALQVHCGAVLQWEQVGSVTVLVVEPTEEYKDVPEDYWAVIEAAEAEGSDICVTYDDAEEGAPPYTAVHVEPYQPR